MYAISRVSKLLKDRAAAQSAIAYEQDYATRRPQRQLHAACVMFLLLRVRFRFRRRVLLVLLLNFDSTLHLNLVRVVISFRSDVYKSDSL